MQPFTKVTSTAVPLPIEHVDTDQIIPARFLKAIDKKGFGKNLFRDWRYDRDGSVNPHFVLNNDLYKGEILVSGKNFGCGSSREHAAWALYQYGFRVVVSSFFADIFKNNALNNGIVPIEVSDHDLGLIFEQIEKNKASSFTVDLVEQTFRIDSLEKIIQFDIDPYKKECLITGMDDIDFLLALSDEIATFEKQQILF